MPAADFFFFGAPFPRCFALSKRSVARHSRQRYMVVVVCLRVDIFQSLLLVIIPHLEVRIRSLEIFEGHRLSRVVRGHGWAP